MCQDFRIFRGVQLTSFLVQHVLVTVPHIDPLRRQMDLSLRGAKHDVVRGFRPGIEKVEDGSLLISLRPEGTRIPS